MHTIKTTFRYEETTVSTETWDDTAVNAAIQRGIAAVLEPKIQARRRAEWRLKAAVEKLQEGKF